MTITRPRLAAVLLCLLLAAIVGLIVYGGRSNPQFVHRPTMAYDMAEPPAVPSIAYEPAMPSLRSGTPAAAGPNVAPTAAPGVAFSYRYGFRLPGARIAAVQEQHAQRCERLGVARCRITGMLYRVQDGGAVEARLELRLAPDLARAFGRSATDAVVGAQGMLAESEISGTDAGAAIVDAGRRLAELNAELARIEARLRTAGTSPGMRDTIEFQAQAVRDQIAALRDGRTAQQTMLAATPMQLLYQATAAAPESAAPATPAEALRRATGNFLGATNILLVILATLLPWALAAMAGWALIRALRRRWPTPTAKA
jgi:hypothetical protein